MERGGYLPIGLAVAAPSLPAPRPDDQSTPVLGKAGQLMADGIGISETAKGSEERHAGNTWLCPLCDHVTGYGKMGCQEPEACRLGEKNIHWQMRYLVDEDYLRELPF